MSLNLFGKLKHALRLGLLGLKAQHFPLPDLIDSDSLRSLLNRPQREFDTTDLRAFYSGQRIMVTGAGGSIGSEIAMQVLRLGAAHVTLVDHSELALYEIDRRVRDSGLAATARPVICSIRHRDRLMALVAAEKPDVIFHAAALKHVPMVELNPSESVLTNIKGTQNLIDAAKAADVKRLVLISSDKAVAPASLMGATKRLAEYLIASQITERFQACTVRFGNVLGSTGSVVPLFKSQIEQGGPITITDKDAERFFMTIFEAVQLVLKAAKYNAETAADKSGLYILEMGKPVRIVDLAQRLLGLYGLTDKDIPIRFTALRDGEKITEALVDDNEVRKPIIEGVYEVLPHLRPKPLPVGSFETLYGLASDGRDTDAKFKVFELVQSIREA